MSICGQAARHSVSCCPGDICKVAQPVTSQESTHCLNVKSASPLLAIVKFRRIDNRQTSNQQPRNWSAILGWYQSDFESHQHIGLPSADSRGSRKCDVCRRRKPEAPVDLTREACTARLFQFVAAKACICATVAFVAVIASV